MNLTYEHMMTVAERYCGIMETIDPRKDPDVRNKVRELFASELIVRFGDPARFQNREEWVEQLCGHADRYRVEVIHKPLPYYIMVDERKKLAACFVKERWKHPGTGEIFGEFLLNMHFEFILEGDVVRLRRILLSRVPSIFQVDTLPK